MLSVLHSAAAGIRSNQRGLETVGDNVANANTPGYRAQRYDPSADDVRPRRDASLREPNESDPPPSDVDLAEEFVDLVRYELGTRANATVIRVVDRTLGRLLNVLADDSPQ